TDPRRRRTGASSVVFFSHLRVETSTAYSLSVPNQIPHSRRFRSSATTFSSALPLYTIMLAKGRKVSGRGETVAANYAFGPLEDDAIIKHRLLTRTTTTRGEPPLKKLQKKFSSFVIEADKDEDNYNDCLRLSKAFLQELNTFEIPLLKSKAVIDANVREKENFTDLKDEINKQILQAQTDIEDLKKQLEESKIERQHKEECEAIRKLIAMQPPRSETQKVITELEKEIVALDTDNTVGSRMLELRKKQFALLLHVVDELQNTIEEDQKSLMEETRIAIEDQKSLTEDASGASEAMALD
ncbi:THO complex subunit 7A, partial [Linum perenne]